MILESLPGVGFHGSDGFGQLNKLEGAAFDVVNTAIRPCMAKVVVIVRICVRGHKLMVPTFTCNHHDGLLFVSVPIFVVVIRRIVLVTVRAIKDVEQVGKRLISCCLTRQAAEAVGGARALAGAVPEGLEGLPHAHQM